MVVRIAMTCYGDQWGMFEFFWMLFHGDQDSQV
jgi:hypothetical protein